VLPVIFTPAAQAEILEARDWYIGHGSDVAARFTVEIERIVERVAAAPQQFPIVFRFS
jgi:plasmid stabilization system protein ParE